jgi:maltose O-acetyltransferase
MKLNRSIYAFLNNLLNVFPGFGSPLSWRGRLAGLAFEQCGKNLKISSNVNIYNPQNISAGDSVYIGYNCYFGGGEIVLEDEVMIGPFVTIVAGNHTMRDGSFRFGPYEYGRIHIGRGTWICANSVICSNVTIGKGCLVAAGSVVTSDVADFSMVGGVPARFIKTVAPEAQVPGQSEALKMHTKADA